MNEWSIYIALYNLYSTVPKCFSHVRVVYQSWFLQLVCRSRLIFQLVQLGCVQGHVALSSAASSTTKLLSKVKRRTPIPIPPKRKVSVYLCLSIFTLTKKSVYSPLGLSSPFPTRIPEVLHSLLHRLHAELAHQPTGSRGGRRSGQAGQFPV